MFFWRISSISLLFSLLLYNFVNCNIYMIARSSLKNNCLYEIYCIYSPLFPYLGYSADIQIHRYRKRFE